jgi:hypothetical protein
MRSNALLGAAALAATVATGTSVGAWAQTAADPHPVLRLVQATPPAAPGAMPGPGAQPGQPGMMPPGGMGPGMMGGMMPPGMMGGMPMTVHGHMMKVMFAIADVNGDGALSFEEVTTMHKRIFDNVDANRDGKVTPMEFQAFMRD